MYRGITDKLPIVWAPSSAVRTLLYTSETGIERFKSRMYGRNTLCMEKGAVDAIDSQTNLQGIDFFSCVLHDLCTVLT